MKRKDKIFLMLINCCLRDMELDMEIVNIMPTLKHGVAVAYLAPLMLGFTNKKNLRFDIFNYLSSFSLQAPIRYRTMNGLTSS